MRAEEIGRGPEPRAVGVVGAGVIGVGVVQALAQAGVVAVAVDRDEARLDAARRELERDLRLARMLGRAPTVDSAEVLDRVRWTTDFGALSSVDGVVENTTERWETKAEVYPQLDAHCPPGAWFAVNTSVFRIADVAALTERPAQVVGVHFMNPVPLRPAAEVIPAASTSEDTLGRVLALLDRMGKRAIVVGDAPGFVSNRVLMLTVAESVRVLEEGTAGADDIDAVFTQCFSHAMGPLATADLIGLDTILHSLEALEHAYGDARFAPPALLREMVERGALGRKSGEGFRRYFTPMSEERA